MNRDPRTGPGALREERFRSLLAVGAHLGSIRDPEALVRSLGRELRRLLAFDYMSLFLPDAFGEPPGWYVLDVENESILTPAAGIPMEGTVGSWVFDHQTAYSFPFARDHPHFPEVEEQLTEYGIRSLCAVPLTTGSRRLGTLAVASRRAGAYPDDDRRFLSLIADQVATALDNALAYREIAELRDRLAQEKLYLEDEIRSELSFDEIVGRSAALRRALNDVETVAPTDSTVLIHGETGSGKELIARAIHNLSARKGKTFVKLSCATIPTGLLESELFGHQKGAFTGAIADRIGRFELASGGTVFLDEIGEIPLELQPKLLRVLQEREFERIGSSRTLKTDARLIAATNRDLSAMVEQQTFRADLFYRLNVFPVHVPPLRERPEDIPLLVRHFVQQFGRRMNKRVDTIPAETMAALTRYDWPGNIRELQNLIERAMILTTGAVLRVPLRDLLEAHGPPRPEARKARTLREAERAHILAALAETKWVLAGPKGAAARLGMNRSTLQFRMKKLGIVRPRR